MKTLFTALAIATTCCLAAEVAYTPAGSKAQGALLVLPLKQANSNNTTSTTPRTVGNGTEKADGVNANQSEQLEQRQSSQQGVFHVYLQDGRLQKVQYITAPITSGQQAQQQQASESSNNQQQTPEIISPEFADRRRVFFVEVPQERTQALQASAQQVSQQNTQTSTPAQYKQEGSTPMNVRYLPLEDTSSPSQYRQELASEVPVVRYLPVPLPEDSRKSEGASGQQVVLQYSEVQPIRGPVFSYSPQAITRILRYAPEY